jgi:hypothetical protein
VANGWSRLQWSVLDWNTPSIEFYKSLGAVLMDEWTVCRLSGPALEVLAKETVEQTVEQTAKETR